MLYSSLKQSMHCFAVQQPERFIRGGMMRSVYRQASSFGELLKAIRTQKQISQQELASRMGVHRNTISAWERGDRLPDTRGTVLELGRQLDLDEQETGLLLEASLLAVVTHWFVPFQRNLFFTGRTEILRRIHETLRQEKTATLTQSYALS